MTAPPGTSPPDSLVYFAGPFSDEERNRIHQALDRVERTGSFPDPPPEAGRPWIAVKHGNGVATTVAVVRLGMGTSLAFTGRTTVMVIEKISDWLDGKADG